MWCMGSLFLFLRAVVKAMFMPRISVPPLCRGLGGLEGASQRSLQRNGTIRKTFSGGMSAIRRHSQCISVKLQAVSMPLHALHPKNICQVSLFTVSVSLSSCRMLLWTWFVVPGQCSCSVFMQRLAVEGLMFQHSEFSCSPHRSCQPCSSIAQVSICPLSITGVGELN